MFRFAFPLLAVGATIISLIIAPSQYAAAANPFALGEVIVSVGGGRYEVYSQDGTLLDTIDCTSILTGSFNTGTFVDQANGFFYGTEFDANKVCRTDLSGDGPVSFGSGYSTPESITKRTSGNLLFGNLGNGFVELNQTGGLVNNYPGAGRVDWHDLLSDGCNVLYTREDSNIYSYNLCTDSANPNFATSPGHGFAALRILGNGDVLAAGNAEIVRFNSTGAVVDTYDDPAAGTWFALNLDPDGTSFWSAAAGFSDIYKFDIATGAILEQWTPTTNGNVFGLSVVGEVTQLNDPCNGIDDNGNQVIDEGVVGVDDDGDGTIDEASEACGESVVVGGEILGIDMASLFVAGALANSGWLITIAGISAAGITGFLLTRRK